MSEKDKYVLIVERDTYSPTEYDRPIVFEQYLDGEAGSLESVESQRKRLGGKYGKTRIARLEFLGDWE